MPGAEDGKADNSRPRRSPASLLTESTHMFSSLHVPCTQTSSCSVCSHTDQSFFPLISSALLGPLPGVSHPSLPLSVPITCVLVQASLLSLGHFSGLLTSLTTLGLCFFTVSELSSTFPCQKELMCNHSLLLGNPAEVSPGTRMSPNQQALFLKMIHCCFSPFFKDTFLYMDLHLYCTEKNTSYSYREYVRIYTLS